MKRGRRPKPTMLKLLHGEYRPGEHGGVSAAEAWRRFGPPEARAPEPVEEPEWLRRSREGLAQHRPAPVIPIRRRDDDPHVASASYAASGVRSGLR